MQRIHICQFLLSKTQFFSPFYFIPHVLSDASDESGRVTMKDSASFLCDSMNHWLLSLSPSIRECCAFNLISTHFTVCRSNLLSQSHILSYYSVLVCLGTLARRNNTACWRQIVGANLTEPLSPNGFQHDVGARSVEEQHGT